MKKFLVFLLCLGLTGLPGCAAIARNYVIATVQERGLSDASIVAFANDYKQAWNKRLQVNKGLELGAGALETELGAISGLSSVLSFVFPIASIVSIASGLISKLLDVVNPGGREDAYQDGIRMISEAETEFYGVMAKGNSTAAVAADKMTDAGVALLKKVNAAISLVESALSNRVSNTRDLTTATTPAAVN